MACNCAFLGRSYASSRPNSEEESHLFRPRACHITDFLVPHYHHFSLGPSLVDATKMDFRSKTMLRSRNPTQHESQTRTPQRSRNLGITTPRMASLCHIPQSRRHTRDLNDRFRRRRLDKTKRLQPQDSILGQRIPKNWCPFHGSNLQKSPHRNHGIWNRSLSIPNARNA